MTVKLTGWPTAIPVMSASLMLAVIWSDDESTIWMKPLDALDELELLDELGLPPTLPLIAVTMPACDAVSVAAARLSCAVCNCCSEMAY